MDNAGNWYVYPTHDILQQYYKIEILEVFPHFPQNFDPQNHVKRIVRERF